MNYEELFKLDDLTARIELYTDRALFINAVADGERMYMYDCKEDAECALKRIITYSEIIDDYLCLIRGKLDELNKFKKHLCEEFRAQKCREDAAQKGETE